MPRPASAAVPVAPQLSEATAPRSLKSSLSAPEGRDLSARWTPALDFARQDYLALARTVTRTASRTLGEAEVDRLANRLARFLMLPVAHCYASGTEAIRATFHGLLQPGDPIVIDAGAPAAMRLAARQAGAETLLSPSGLIDGVERRLARLPRHRPVHVAVSAMAAYSSVSADLADMVTLCRAHGARLIVDVSHDLGSTAQSGRGIMELQGCLGQIDVVLGSLGKSFGVPGGFVAVRDPNLAALLAPATPLAAKAAACLGTALDLIDSDEGRRRRRRLHGNALRLRNHLMADGLRVLGQPSPLIPLPLHPRDAEAMTTLLHSAGPRVPLLQAPLVAGHAPRWRIILSSDHGPADIDDLADLIRDVCQSFRRMRHPARPAVLLP